MPSKKKKYNARFPPARIKKIMQMDEEVGKVAATVPVIISRALELFIESFIQQATQTAMSKNAKTLSTTHLKHTIESDDKYHFLRELVANVPDYHVEEEGVVNLCNNGEDAASTTNPIKRLRGRPRKLKEGQVTQKKERRKRKQESSTSSDSENSEDTDDADEVTDDDPAPTSTSNVGNVSHVATETSSAATATATLTNSPDASDFLSQSPKPQEDPEEQHLQQQQQLLQQQLLEQHHQQQQQQLNVPEEVTPIVSVPTASTFQAPTMMPAAVPMYQNMPGTATPQIFTWGSAGPPATGILATGIPSVVAQTSCIPALQPQATGFPGMMMPSLSFPAVPATMLAFQGLPGSSFPGISPLGPGFSAINVTGTGLPGLPAKGPTVTGGPGRSQEDDDYDT